MSMVCVHCVITGRVQGVFFRATTRDRANALGLTGWVKNTEDGKVEAIICGESHHVDELCKWLHKGPPLAKVKEVIFSEIEWQDHKHFEKL